MSAKPPTTGYIRAKDTIAGSGVPADPAVIAAMRAQQKGLRHYTAIGLVAGHWSYFEAAIDAACVELAGINDHVGVCFTAQIAGSGRKLDAYISLARLRGIPKKLIAELCDFAKDSSGLAEQRNRIVHDVWIFPDPDKPERKEATAKKLARLERIPTSTEDLFNFATKIFEHRNRFDALVNRVLAEPSSSPSKRSEGTLP
jgi:hypothetical protein